MIVVSDAIPLNFLVRLELIDVLPLLYRRILIPEGVLGELRHDRTPQKVRLWARELPEWITVMRVEQIDGSLPIGLGVGEREAITLCLTAQASLLLVDDLSARRSAERRRIPVTGMLGILGEASLLKGYDFEELVGRLQRLGFRASSGLIASVLANHQEAMTSNPLKRGT